MTFLPNQFLSNIKAKDGLARPCRFQVILPIPQIVNKFIGQSLLENILNLPNRIVADVTSTMTSLQGNNMVSANPSITRYLSLQCETAELPGRTIMTEEVQIYGPTTRRPYQTNYEDFTLTFLCTNDFYERKLFDRWLDCIQPSDTNNVRYALGENSYLTNPTIIQYDDFIKQIYAVQFIDAYPTSIASQPLSWGDEGFHRVTIQFTYWSFKTIFTGNYDVVGAASELLGNYAGNQLINPMETSYSNLLTKIFN